MLNDVSLDKMNRFYIVNHNGKTYTCDRVTNVIENTFPTPEYLKRWMVNCAVEALIDCDPKVDLVIRKAIGWQAHKKVSEQALVDGSQVHQAIDHGVENNLTSDAARACLRGFKEFIAEFIPVKIAGELKVYDTKNGVAGTIDNLSLSAKDRAKKKTLWILDWKTSKQISRVYKIQIVVYKWMLLNLIKEYLKNPTQYNIATQKIMNDIVLACGKKPKIKCMIIRLNKKLKARILHEKCELTAKEEKSLLEEFKLMIKLHNKRKGQEQW